MKRAASQARPCPKFPADEQRVLMGVAAACTFWLVVRYGVVDHHMQGVPRRIHALCCSLSCLRRR